MSLFEVRHQSADSVLTDSRQQGAAAQRSPTCFFTGPSGGRANTRTLLKDLQKLAKPLTIPVGRGEEGIVTHSFRHYFETCCVNRCYVSEVRLSLEGELATGSRINQ